MTTATNEDIKAMTFEQALEALERIVDDLEKGDVPLDQSIRIYERGGEDPPVARGQTRRRRAARSGLSGGQASS
jgi:hypothetical protein